MNKREARRMNDVALNIFDLVHCLHTGTANEISFDTWQDMFARGKDYEAARKQWQRLKRELERHGVIEHVADGREDHVVVKPGAMATAEALRAQAQAVLEEGKEETRTYPDQLTFEAPGGRRTFRLKVYGRDIPFMDDRQYEELKASIAANGIEVAVEVDKHDAVVDGKTRLTIAHALKIPLREIPIHVREETDRAALERIAAELNDRRRHYTKLQLAERRRVRQESARAKRVEGKSTWQIAEEEGVSQRTIRKDIAGTPEGDGPVLGKDGKRRSRRRSTEERKARRHADIKELLAKNPHLTVRDLVAELGCSAGTVCGDLKALAEGQERGSSPAVVTFAAGNAGPSVLGVDPEGDDVRACLEAALTGVEQLREAVRGTAAEPTADGVHKIIDTLIWRLLEGEAA